MKHAILAPDLRNREALEALLSEHEALGYSVVGMGNIVGERLFMFKDGRLWNHQIVAVTGRKDDTLKKILLQREHEGWVVCGIGACGEATVMILKRPAPQVATPS
jgi:hypothetical protein